MPRTAFKKKIGRSLKFWEGRGKLECLGGKLRLPHVVDVCAYVCSCGGTKNNYMN